MIRFSVLMALYSWHVMPPVLSMQREFQVINRTMIVGERDIFDRDKVILFDSSTDSTIVSTSTVYSYNDEMESIVVSGNVYPPETFVRCNLGCHPNLLNFTEFCYRVNPPSCIEMGSKIPVVYNVTSSSWYPADDYTVIKDSLYTTYSIVY
jgi:hypothetical protein